MEKSHLEWIGQEIEEARTLRGLTLERLAGMTCNLHDSYPDKYNSCTRTALIKIRDGKTKNPRPKTLASIAHVLGLSDDYFLPTVRTLDEKLIYERAMDYLIQHEITLDQPLDDVINDVLYDEYDIDTKTMFQYLRFKGCEIVYDVTDTELLQASKKSLILKKQDKQQDEKDVHIYENAIKKLQDKLDTLSIPDEYDTDLSEQDAYYETQALLHEKMQEYEDYKKAFSPIPTQAEIHYHAKDTAINTALATGTDLKDVPLIARITKTPILFEGDSEPTEFPPVEMSIQKFAEATKQIDMLTKFLFEL